MACIWEAHLSEFAIRSARFTSPALFALGGLNAWVGQTAGDSLPYPAGCASVSARLALFGEDLLQRGYRADRAVLVYVAAHPGVTTRQVAQAIGTPERLAARNLDRLTDDGLLSVTTDGVPRVLRSYRLPLADGELTETSGS